MWSSTVFIVLNPFVLSVFRQKTALRWQSAALLGACEKMSFCNKFIFEIEFEIRHCTMSYTVIQCGNVFLL